MTDKLLVISVKHPLKSSYRPQEDEPIFLYDHECENIMEKFKDREISSDDILEATNLLIANFVRTNTYKLVVDINSYNKSLAPAKEMTIEELEKELGYKIRIIGGKEE